MSRVVLLLGDDVSTDLIYPGRFMATVLPSETPRHAFADHAAFNAKLVAGEIPPGSVIAAGSNFGCGSSREQAASCLKGYDLVIVARSFARIFLQNAINLGLKVVPCPGLETKEGDDLAFEGGTVVNRTAGRSFSAEPMPKARQAILDAGGLIPYTRKKLMQMADRKDA